MKKQEEISAPGELNLIFFSCRQDQVRSKGWVIAVGDRTSAPEIDKVEGLVPFCFLIVSFFFILLSHVRWHARTCLMYTNPLL